MSYPPTEPAPKYPYTNVCAICGGRATRFVSWLGGPHYEALGYVLPRTPMNDVKDQGLTDLVLSCQASGGCTLVGILPANIADLFRCEFGAPVPFPSRVTVLSGCVTMISSSITEEQVRGVDTRRIVATVANKKTVRYWAVVKFVAEAVCGSGLRIDRELTVSTPRSKHRSGPYPTLTKLGNVRRCRSLFVNFGPKALGRYGGATSMGVSIDKSDGLALSLASRSLVPYSNRGWLTTATFAQTRGIKYTVHAETPLLSGGHASGCSKQRGRFIVPNYTTFRGIQA